MFRERNIVYSENDMKSRNIMYGKNPQISLLKLMVHTVIRHSASKG